MSLVTEHFNGGIVTARDPAELVPGELQRGDECVYRLHDPAIYGRPGRTKYNTTTIKDSTGAICAVKGLAHLSFEGTRTDQILALGGTGNNQGTLWAGNFTAIDGSATFTQLTGPGQVTDAVLTASTTVTSASGGFANMVQGARITGTNIPIGAVVTLVNSSTNITISVAATGSGTITATFDMGIAFSPADAGTETMTMVQWGTNYYGAGFGPLTRIFYKGRSITTAQLSDLLVARPAGLDPVVVAPTVARVAGTWPSALGNGYYWFLVTEINNPGGADEVEGTYTPVDVNNKKLGPVAGQITDFTTQTIQITFPAQVNTGSRGRLSTHWAIYMSLKQSDNSTVPSLATFRRIAITPISNTTLTLTDTSTATNPTQSKYVGAVAALGGRPQFTNATNMIGAPNQLLATNSGTDSANKLQNFGFSTGAPYATGTITGIRVVVTMTALFSSAVIKLTTTAGKTSFPVITVGNTGYSAQSLGGQFDTWGVAWVPSDFADGTFEVTIEKTPGTGGFLQIDAVQVIVYYSGGSINVNGPPFRVVTYRDEIGFTIDEPARLPPPNCTTAAVFQGSIVSNDTSNEATLRWSLPGEPEAWPRPYQLLFNGSKRDKITCIKKLNQVLVIGLRETIERVDTLPSETDTDFKEGLVHAPITEDHGIVGPQAAAIFTRQVPPYAMSYMRYGAGMHLAYVSYSALHITDGVTSSFLNTDIRLSDYIAPAFIQNCVLKNYPKEQWLVLFYTPIGGTKNTKALIFPYGEPKEDGTLRAIGPISVSGRSACTATLNGTPILLTGHDFGGTIWTEDQGNDLTGYTLDGSTQLVAVPSITTRRFYPAGIDRNARTEKQYIQHDAFGVATSMTTVVMTKGSVTLTRAAGWAGVTKGMRIVHTNMPGDSIVTNIVGNNLTSSQAASETLTDTVVFDTGTLSVTLRAQSIGTVITEVGTTYSSTLLGGLLSTSQDGNAQAFDLMIEKIRMLDDTLLDLNTGMRLHHFTYEINDGGKEQSRTGAL